jgi:DNA-binding NarL/FixJ family response regulator
MEHDTIHIAIVDDYPVVLRGFESYLTNAPHIKIIGTAMYGDDLMPLLAQNHVDLLLLDINVPTSRENKLPYPIFHVIPRVIELYPHINVVITTMYAENTLIKAIIETGVSGYILKDDLHAVQEFGSIITSIVRENGRYWSPVVLQTLEQAKKKNEDAPSLTPRQLQVTSLCATYPEKPTVELAEHLHIADSTFRNHLSDAYLTLGVPNRAAAVAKARQLGLIASGDPPPLSDPQDDTDDQPDD